MVTQTDYSAELVKAARSVLLELFHLLGAYWKHIVLVGGWVPEFLLSTQDKHHVGSIDVDLALKTTWNSEMKDTDLSSHYCLKGGTLRANSRSFFIGRSC